MADYSVLKEELSTKSNEIFKLQQQIKKYLSTVWYWKKEIHWNLSLEDNLNTKEPQLKDQAWRELYRVQSAFSAEETLWRKEKRKLEAKLVAFRIFF